MEYGLVLAGGGAKGAYEIGALLAIQEYNLIDKIKVVSGNSIGSVNLALYAGGDLQKAKHIWENINPDDFIELDDNGFDITKAGDGIFSREGLLRLIKSNVDLSKITNAEVTYFITVCKTIYDGTAVPVYVKLNGKSPEIIGQYILASSAIPVVYDAVTVEGESYFDGGLCDNTPIRPVYDEGAKNIIVISNDYQYVSEQFYYPNAKLINIIPSHDLSVDSLIATVDLSKHNAYYRLKLGYLDAKAVLNAHFNGGKPELSMNHQLALRELSHAKLSSSVNENMQGLARILGTTDLFNI